MTDAKTEILSLHSRVNEADEGDAGWVWYQGDWRLGMVMSGPDDNDDSLFVDLILPEGSQWFHMVDLKDLPWLPISRPPYEGNEKPCTHAVTIRCHGSSVTFSWNMNVSDGRATTGKIIQAVESMLHETDAPVSVR